MSPKRRNFLEYQGLMSQRNRDGEIEIGEAITIFNDVKRPVLNNNPVELDPSALCKNHVYEEDCPHEFPYNPTRAERKRHNREYGRESIQDFTRRMIRDRQRGGQ